ncbi:MAG TPA: peptidoglycan-binding domain-containing protein [Burkholderiaceae bacterium]|nr:peptidoglycan-binding domain-containing protein [Burkholderiaceae bacterium]
MPRLDKFPAFSLIACAVLATGCASTPQQPAVPAIAAAPAVDPAALARAEAEKHAAAEKARADALEMKLKQAEADAARARADASQRAPAPAPDTGLFPPDAQPGHCYARVLTPPQLRTVTETVTVKEASERLVSEPAVYKDAPEQVLVREASKRIETVPAVYETITESVLVKPAGKRLVEVPAVYRTESERVVDEPAHTDWKRGPAGSVPASLAAGGRVLDTQTVGTGEVMCLVEVPATYKTITRQVLVSAAHTEEVEVPAEYQTVQRQVVKSPASTREVDIPAEYRTVTKRVLVTPAQTRHIPIPAETRDVTHTEQVGTPKLGWTNVLCDVNATHSTIQGLQARLHKAGYYSGPLNGTITPATQSAVNAFARDNKLPYGTNFISTDVMKSLGMSL